MPRKKPTMFSLKRGRLRQSWNKYNLYNLAKWRQPLSGKENYFKQKWVAKAQTRYYHGEQVLERHWKRQFKPTMQAVVPMNPLDLARSDGAEQSAGRGAGRDPHPDAEVKRRRAVPYMNMVFAPLERRLDVAIHRALFASSVRQARQFCIHGFVKVNGQKMVYPSYALNPGDMFQVDPDRVLFATGAPKETEERRDTRRFRKSQQAGEGVEAEGEEAKQAPIETQGPLSEDDAKSTLQSLLSRTKALLGEEKQTASAKRKRDLREFSKLVHRTLSRGGKGSAVAEGVPEQVTTLMQNLGIQEQAAPEADDKAAAATSVAGSDRSMTPKQKRDLEQALQELKENPYDPSKPYATPWRPRSFMSAFAFIPRYLEVHHKICSAVYLRHPVARPGLAEVPSPFGAELSGLAFNWYLRRR